MSSNANSTVSENTAIAALAIALVALVTTVLQLAQTIVATAKGLPNCDKRVMGKWAKYTSKKFRLGQLRLEIEFEAPVIFLAPADNKKGPVLGTIWYADGTNKSCEDTRTAFPKDDEAEDNKQGRAGERVHTVDNELATWVTLLGAIQKMERDSTNWEKQRWNNKMKIGQPILETPTLAVGIQSKKRSFDTNPAIKKPYATSTICHLVELAAVLGLYWKVFNRDENKYHAEGNGYSLLGTRLDDFGIVFVFEKYGSPHFKNTRVIPTSEVKELCFGNAPTFYREKTPAVDQAWNNPIKEQKTLQTLQLGSRQEIAETLNLIGCNTNTALYYLREKKHIHLFPVTFEILGMLGRTLHVRNRCFTYLPNPTIFPWNKQSFSIRRLLDAFSTRLDHEVGRLPPLLEGQTVPPELYRIHAVSSNLSGDLPHHDDENGDYTPDHLNKIHSALDITDMILDKDNIKKSLVLDVLRHHLQVVLEAINTSAPSVDKTSSNNIHSDTAEDADISFDDLLSVSPQRREDEFINKYFDQIRERVITATSMEYPDTQAMNALHTLPQRQDTNSQEEETATTGQSQNSNTQQPNTSTSADPQSTSLDHQPTPIATSNRVQTGRSIGSSLFSAMTRRTRANIPVKIIEMRLNMIWCTLVFRMICWLLLHDFDKKDVQLPKNELMGSRLPVYIM